MACSPARISTARETGSYSKPRQASTVASPGGQGHREAAVGVEVVVLGHADDAGVAAGREVGAPVGAGQVDPGRQEFAVRVADANAELAGGLGPGVAVDPHRLGRAAPAGDRVEPEPHPVVDGARLVRGAAVPGVHQALAIRGPGREVLVGAGVGEADGLDPARRLLARDGVEVVVARGVRDVGDDAPVRGDHRRRLVVGLDPNEEFYRSGRGAIPPEGTRTERRLAPPGNEHDVAGVADPVSGHVVGLRVGDDGFGRAGLQVVDPEVEGAVALRGEEDAGPVRRPARPQIEEGVGGKAARLAGREVGDEDVEVAVDVGRVGDLAAVGGPARLGVVAGAARDLAGGAAPGGHDPDAAVAGEGDGLAVG